MTILDRMHIRELLKSRSRAGGTHWEGCWKEHIDCAAEHLLDELEEVEGHYSSALDEIYILRAQLEYEARVQEVSLSYKTFPKSRRKFVEESVKRMRDAAAGKAFDVSLQLGRDGTTYRRILGERTLTRTQWEQTHG